MSERIRVDISGQDPEKWASFRGAFLRRITDLLDTIIDHDQGDSIREVSKDLVSSAIGSLKARLEREGLKNDEILASICHKLAEKESVMATARKTHAEADAIELENTVRRLRIALKGQKAMLIGEGGEECLLFGKQIDALLEAIDDIRFLQN